jgi:hypothetical protein
VRLHERLDLFQHVGVPPERVLGVDQVALKAQPLIVQRRQLDRRERLVDEVRESRPSPQRERLARLRDAPGILAAPRAASASGSDTTRSPSTASSGPSTRNSIARAGSTPLSARAIGQRLSSFSAAFQRGRPGCVHRRSHDTCCRRCYRSCGCRRRVGAFSSQLPLCANPCRRRREELLPIDQRATLLENLRPAEQAVLPGSPGDEQGSVRPRASNRVHVGAHHPLRDPERPHR